MPGRRPIPPALVGRAFTTAEASALGVSPTVLRRRATSLHHGVWCFGPPPVDLAGTVRAARLALPRDAVLSHTSALRALGVDLGPSTLHFSVRGPQQTRSAAVVLHRRRAAVPAIRTGHVGAVTTPGRTFIDAATVLGLRDLVRAGDFLVRRRLLDLGSLLRLVHDSHLDGVVRARRAALMVREGVDSVRETDVRLLLRFARLPEPECNTNIEDGGRVVARGDLPFRDHRVLVEYDGWHHERDARQRQKDHLRRERIEAAGWIVAVVTVEDLRDPVGVVRRVHAALVRRGYRGPAPVMSDTWRRWFAHDPRDV